MNSKKQIIIELGSTNVSIYTDTLICRQPNLAIVRKGYSLELIAAGNQALAMLRDLPKHCYLVKPVEEGTVINTEVMGLILKSFFSQTIPNYSKKSTLYCIIPCGLSTMERENIEKAIAKTGIYDITLVESLFCLMPYIKDKPTAVAVFGGGVTEIGVIDSTGIVSGCTINLAGNTINEKIKEIVLERYNLMITWATAEKLKLGIGTLYENTYTNMEIAGKDILVGKVKVVNIDAESIRGAITECYKKLVDVIESILTTIPRDLLPEVSQNGVLVAGGGAEINGLTNFLTKYLRIPIHLLDSPEIVTIKGLSQILSSHDKIYSKVFENKR